MVIFSESELFALGSIFHLSLLGIQVPSYHHPTGWRFDGERNATRTLAFERDNPGSR